MAETGVLDPDERVELLDGEVVEMAAIGSRHAGCVNRMTLLCVEGFGRELTVCVQNPVRIDAYTELVPDLMLLLRRDDFYAELSRARTTSSWSSRSPMRPWSGTGT